jgi:hypothetical protein
LGQAEKVVRFKGTFLLFLILAVLGGYVYFTEFRNKEARDKQEETKKRLFSGEAADISEITLEFEGRTVTGVRKDKAWQITSPAGLDADSETWDQLASSFLLIEKEETVSAQKTDLAPYGLDKPTVKVTAKFKNGSASTVLFGVENPKKEFNYAKRSENDEVFLSPAAASGNFKKTLTDLRDKKVLAFEADNIDSVKVSATGKPEIELQKSGMDWMIKKPQETRADNGEVSGFLSAIQFARASAFAEESVDAKTTGIDAPVARVTLHDKKAGVDRTLLFGKSPEKDKYYAKDQSRSPVFILAADIFQKTQQPATNWRDKSIVHFGEGGVGSLDEVEIVRGADKIVLKKVGNDWQADGKKTQVGKVFDMLSGLEGQKATELVDAPSALATYGLDKPRITVSLRKGGKEVESFRFGRENTSPAGVYLKTSGPTVMLVEKGLFERFDVKTSDLLEPPAAPAAPAK